MSDGMYEVTTHIPCHVKSRIFLSRPWCSVCIAWISLTLSAMALCSGAASLSVRVFLPAHCVKSHWHKTPGYRASDVHRQSLSPDCLASQKSACAFAGKMALVFAHKNYQCIVGSWGSSPLKENSSSMFWRSTSSGAQGKRGLDHL